MVEEKTFEELDELATKLQIACPVNGVDCAEEKRAERQVNAMIGELEASLAPQDLLRLKCICAIRLGCVGEFLGA